MGVPVSFLSIFPEKSGCPRFPRKKWVSPFSPFPEYLFRTAWLFILARLASECGDGPKYTDIEVWGTK